MTKERKRAPVTEIDDYVQGVATLATLLLSADIQRGFTLGSDALSLVQIEKRIVSATWILYLVKQGGDYAVQNEETQPVQPVQQTPVRRKGERRGTR